MRSSVDYWCVGRHSPTDLQLSAGTISSHLAADWVPSLSAVVGSSLMLWPQQLTYSATINGKKRLCLHGALGKSDRQWKGMVSWMLGVAGARQVLKDEGYVWIAPLSAFYPNSKTNVSVPTSPPNFNPSKVKIDSNPVITARLRPDYIALRPNISGQYDWAVVEAKGTSIAIASRHRCPKDWHLQVRNAVVTQNSKTITVNRHLVVATRVNPNGKYNNSRQVQVRAWNSEQTSESEPSNEAALELVSAHLFGILMNLGLTANARAIAFSTRSSSIQSQDEQRNDLVAKAREELVAISPAYVQQRHSEPLIIERRERQVIVELILSAESLNLIEALQVSDFARVQEELRIVERKEPGSQQDLDDELHELPSGFAVRFLN